MHIFKVVPDTSAAVDTGSQYGDVFEIRAYQDSSRSSLHGEQQWRCLSACEIGDTMTPARMLAVESASI